MMEAHKVAQHLVNKAIIPRKNLTWRNRSKIKAMEKNVANQIECLLAQIKYIQIN